MGVVTDDPRLAALCQFAEVVAAELVANPTDRQDAAQEGRIAAWRVLQSHPEATPAYHRTSIKNAIKGFLRGCPTVGHEGRRGWQEAPTTFVGEFMPDQHPGREDSYPSEWGHVREAVAQLPERERGVVVQHHWGGRTLREISTERGKNREWAGEVAREWAYPLLREAPGMAE